MIWISSTENELWSQNNKTIKNPTEKGSELIIGERIGRPLYGWGCCISEICAKAVLELSEDKQKTIFDELFGAENCGFDYCRLSTGANDFAESWYSYDETDGDYALEHFSVARDEKYIFPAIREAKKRSPELRFFAISLESADLDEIPEGLQLRQTCGNRRKFKGLCAVFPPVFGRIC